MTHPDAGRLRALLDDEIEPVEADRLRAHVAVCGACDIALRGAAETGALATALLDSLDGSAPTERVRARLAARRREAHPPASRDRWEARPFLRRRDLARAALLTLGFAGAVAAAVHPASPLRGWLGGDDPSAAVEADATAVEAPEAREVGVRVAVGTGGIRIALSSVPSGAVIAVEWADGPAAVYAPEGSRFTTSESQGRIDAAVVGGPVRIELPRNAARALLVVDGRVFLEKTGERVDYPGPPATVTGSSVRFEVR